MKNLITSEYKHLLWMDECGDDFLLLPWCEIFRYSKNVLGVYYFFSENAPLGRLRGLIFDFQKLDEVFYAFYTKVSNLPLLIALGAYRRRPDLRGSTIKKREKQLAHKIYPYRPKLKQ